MIRMGKSIRHKWVKNPCFLLSVPAEFFSKDSGLSQSSHDSPSSVLFKFQTVMILNIQTILK